MKQFILINIFISSIIHFNSYGDYFPHEDKWMMSILQSKSLIWSDREMDVKFTLTKKKQIKVKLVFSTSVYDYDRSWRKKVIKRMNYLYPKIIKEVYKYSSKELLSIFDPRLDIEWQIYLSKSLYGEFKQGKLLWKKGIY
ncbi:MAG: hypothetical protein COB02_07770 [Candidatus Cloacimonadota bacterium]|nr:MAG: hypothetical protein COB02_07770 [Candidatus Cloacimonadota bacterium]